MRKLTDYNSYELSAVDDAAVFYAIPAPVAVAAQAVMDAANEHVECGDISEQHYTTSIKLQDALAAYEEACK